MLLVSSSSLRSVFSSGMIGANGGDNERNHSTVPITSQQTRGYTTTRHSRRSSRLQQGIPRSTSVLKHLFRARGKAEWCLFQWQIWKAIWMGGDHSRCTASSHQIRTYHPVLLVALVGTPQDHQTRTILDIFPVRIIHRVRPLSTAWKLVRR